MKQVIRSKRFMKVYKKRILPNKKLKAQFDERLRLFISGVRGEPINDHSLTKQMKGLRSFSVSGDVRVIYLETETAYELLDIGTHNQVYN